MRKKNYPEIEDARGKAGELYVMLGRLLVKLEQTRRMYDECLRLQRAKKLRAEDIGRCNFCAELLNEKRPVWAQTTAMTPSCRQCRCNFVELPNPSTVFPSGVPIGNF